MSTTVTFRLDDETNNRQVNLTGATDRSKVYLATRALQLFLDNNEWQVQEIKQAFTDADSASSDQFVDNEVVMAWMESWEAEDESQDALLILRELIVDRTPYILPYRVRDNRIEILRVLHTSRRWPNQF